MSALVHNFINDDTIAAIATAQGEGGIAIVRVSGRDAKAIAERCFRPARGGGLKPGRVRFGDVLDCEMAKIDEAIALYMKAPKSYTREDVVEIHCHGGRVCARRVLETVISLGARIAQPGEFTRRAFLNGRIELTEAEAVMGLISAGGEAAARAAVRQMDGGVSRFVKGIKERLIALLSLIEASDDFPDEIEEQAAAGEILPELKEILRELERATDARGARILREGISVVLAGRPNVGKSSLMNALLDQDRAIVDAAPGTTRDVLTERLRVDGLVLELTDTAGQRETSDPVEGIGVDRARRAEAQADIVLLVVDASEAMDERERARVRGADERYLIVLNKTDVSHAVVGEEELRRLSGGEVLSVSAVTGEGIRELLLAIVEAAGAGEIGQDHMTAERHIECARRVRESIERAIGTLEAGSPVDLASVDLWDAMQALAEITGEDATEDVIERIFASFCVGK